MITQPGRYPVSAEHIATGNKYTYSEADDVVGVVQSTTDAANSPATHADVSNADGAHQADQAIHSSADGGHSPTQESANLTVLIPADDHTYSLDESHATASSTTDLSPVPATSGWFSDDHLSGIFDHIESLSNGPASVGSLSDGVTTSYNDDQGGFPSAGPTTSPSLSFDSPDSTAIDVFSQAKSHGGGGGSTGGGTVPAAVTISSPLTDVSFHITWDSSVGSAPSGFVSAVESVASFFAGAFNQPHPITINIDVGYGEVGGKRLGPSALGESESYLQSVSYSQLASLYSAGDVTLGGAPSSGNLYSTTAEAKALGLTVSNSIDGYVGFSSQTGIFDFTTSNGTPSIPTGQYDFFGVVAHEFSEVMGRLLLVGQSISGAPGYSVLDLFHYSSGAQDFSGNGGYFSTTAGTNPIAGFNNASNGGDAGDWSSTGTANTTINWTNSLPNGSTYDAFNAFGMAGKSSPVTNTDLWALHAVGFDLAPTVKPA